MFHLRIDVRGKPKYIVDPQEGAARWVATRLGLPTRAAWRAAIWGGRLLETLEAENPEKLQEERDDAVKTTQTLRDERSNYLGEIARQRDNVLVRTNQVASLEARIRNLERTLRERPF